MTKMNEAELMVWAAVFAVEITTDQFGARAAASAATRAVWDLRELAKSERKDIDEHTRAALEQVCPKMLPPGEY